MQEETVTLSPELKKYLYGGIETAIEELKKFAEAIVAGATSAVPSLGTVALEYFQSSINKAIEELSLIGAKPEPPARVDLNLMAQSEAEAIAKLTEFREPTKKIRRRKAHSNGSSNGNLRSATREELLAYMRKHRGTLRLAAFAKESDGIYSKQFLKAGSYAMANGMTKSGLLRKVGPGHYRTV